MWTVFPGMLQAGDPSEAASLLGVQLLRSGSDLRRHRLLNPHDDYISQILIRLACLIAM